MDASRKQHELHLLTQNLLDSNHNLAHRLSLLEDSQVDSALRISWNPGKVDQRSSRLSIASQIRTFGFERDLEGTWVYRKARRSTSDVSFRSSVALSHAWSTLSDVSLSHISAISVIALPLSRSELTNGHYYRLKAPHSSVPQQTSRWKELPPPPPQTNDSIVRPICEPSELHFFVSDFLDSMASTDTDGRSSYARTSIAPSLARGSVASTIYRLDAMVSPLPAQTIVRQRVPIVTIVSNGSNNSVDTSHDTAPDPQSESGEPREVRIGLRRPRGDFPSRISIPPITENDSFVQDNGAEVESVTQSVLDELEGNTEESSLIMSNTQNTPTTYLGKFFATYQICVLGGAGTEKHELEQQVSPKIITTLRKTESPTVFIDRSLRVFRSSRGTSRPRTLHCHQI